MEDIRRTGEGERLNLARVLPPFAETRQGGQCHRDRQSFYRTGVRHSPPQVFAPDQIGVIEEVGCTARCNWPAPG